MTLKQVIVLNQGIDMSSGKMAAQACHASLGAYKKVSGDTRNEWEMKGAKKIILGNGERDIMEIHQDAERKDLPSFMVKDAGMTELEPGTKTAVGIGPAEEQKIDSITGDLKLIH